ncbi:hypothetical protein [Roseovarius aestuariivivens]|uniref:hypothetical protein n=1 Tax=Roseovarius aestuariivivens TaxID=1888910 RepID=UPI0010816368|nr:hypothetical protein [Roseovarius aestuariivivens]
MQSFLRQLKTLFAPMQAVGHPASGAPTQGHGLALPEILRRPLRRLVARLSRQVALGPDDTGRIIAHYTALSVTDRTARFHGIMTAQAIADRYCTLDWTRARFLGITFFGRLLALAEIGDFGDAHEPGSEIAVSVLRGWQGVHLGERVLRAALRDVNAVHHLPAHAITRRDNIRFIRLAHKLGATGRVADGEYDAVFAAR